MNSCGCLGGWSCGCDCDWVAVIVIIDVVAVMGGEETQEGPYYNSDTLDDGRIIAPGYVNCLICNMYEQKNKQNRIMAQTTTIFHHPK